MNHKNVEKSGEIESQREDLNLRPADDEGA
jgi:hypothetical protein